MWQSTGSPELVSTLVGSWVTIPLSISSTCWGVTMVGEWIQHHIEIHPNEVDETATNQDLAYARGLAQDTQVCALQMI